MQYLAIFVREHIAVFCVKENHSESAYTRSFCHSRPKLIYEIICVYKKYAEKGEQDGEIQIWEETYGGSPEI